MRVNVYDLDGKPKRKMKLPEIFQAFIRTDLIKRAVLAAQSHRFQPKGRNIMAGKRTSAESYGVGYGLSRVPRVKGQRYSRSGTAAFAPGTVKGRLAHPPTPNKKISKSINKKERLKALTAALAATASKETVVNRGHIIDEKTKLPLIVTDQIEEVKVTNEAQRILLNLGLWSDVERVKESIKVRAGKGKMRGRKMKHGVGPLIIVNEDKGIVKAARNLIGVDVLKVDKLNVEALAPGTHPGRLTLWSEAAVKRIGEKFMGA